MSSKVRSLLKRLTTELMEIAAQPSIPNIRHPSTLEVHWLQKLVDTYGDDYERMMWDRELNPMQHTPAQLKRKIKKWREAA
jgi:nucleolar protein 16